MGRGPLGDFTVETVSCLRILRSNSFRIVPTTLGVVPPPHCDQIAHPPRDSAPAMRSEPLQILNWRSVLDLEALGPNGIARDDNRYMDMIVRMTETGIMQGQPLDVVRAQVLAGSPSN